MKLIKRDPNLGYIDSMLWIPKSQINVDGVKHALEFELPERSMIRVLQLWGESEHHLIVPRAFWKPEDLSFQFIDCRPAYFPKADIRSNICLDMKPGPGGLLQQTGSDLQRKAIEALLGAMGGTLQLACGKGKTVVALHLASILKVPTIIAVDNTHLLKQWQEEIAKHLVVPGGVGLVQGQVKDWRKDIVMATYQTLARWADTMPEVVRRRFGLVIWDEGHHVNAPTFSKSAPLFYGYRLALTATPDRQDGSHVICQHHVGDIIFKDVIQDCPPSITFKWTGFKLNLEDDKVKSAVCDKNGEIHLGKIASHFGNSRERLTSIVLPEVQRLVAMKHKVIVLSYSVDEVINLMTLWAKQDPNALLYSEIPYPTPADVGETLSPVELQPKAAQRLENTIAEIRRNLARQNLPEAKRTAFKARLTSYCELLKQFEVWKKTEKLHRQLQRKFIQDLLGTPSTGGLFTEAVKPEARFKMLRERQVIFAIMKYGKEGLDDKKLSAIVVSEPMSDRNTLQQIMGRPRNKSNSELVFLEDDVSPLIGQCRKLRRHLREWPEEEGGPFRYSLVGHPATLRRQGATTWNQLSQQTTNKWNPVGSKPLRQSSHGSSLPAASASTLHRR